MTEHTTKPFWIQHKEITLAKALYREYRQEMTNPDTKINHPNECKECPEHKKHQPHPEATKRITKLYIKKQNVEMPTVDRPKRYNRQ